MWLLMIMTLFLLVYSIAQRRMRARMKAPETTIPNQINQATATPTPTLGWVFQCFDGINLIQHDDKNIDDKLHIDGLTELREGIINYIGGHAIHLYKIKKLTRNMNNMSLINNTPQ